MTKDDILGYLNKTIHHLKQTGGRRQGRNIDVILDQDIVQEIADQLYKQFKNNSPDIKMAGFVSFWIRKLKPISYAEHTPEKLSCINELAAVLVGTAICRRSLGALAQTKGTLDAKQLKEWTQSFRYNSHSPHSCALAFEMAFRK